MLAIKTRIKLCCASLNDPDIKAFRIPFGKQMGHDGPGSLTGVIFRPKLIFTFLLFLLFHLVTPSVGPVLTLGASYEKT